MELRPSPSTLQYLFWHVVLLFDKAFDFVQICGYQNPLEVFFFRKSDFHHLLKNLLQCLIIAVGIKQHARLVFDSKPRQADDLGDLIHVPGPPGNAT